MPSAERHPQRGFERARRATAAGQEVRRPRRSRRRSRRCGRPQPIHRGQCRAAALVDQRLEARVGLLDRSPRGGVARLGLGRLVARGPRRRIGELLLERRASRPRPPRPPARPSAGRAAGSSTGPLRLAACRGACARRRRAGRAIRRRGGACVRPASRRRSHRGRGIGGVRCRPARSSRTRTYSAQPPT